jgi:ATP/maltotriose-dependent transcriptional regulator MalT
MHKILLGFLFLCILIELNLNACLITVRVTHESYSSNITKSDQFSKWIRKNGRIYKNSTRHVARFKVWLMRDNEISIQNEHFKTGQATFKLEHTRYSDRTNEELATSILGFKFPKKRNILERMMLIDKNENKISLKKATMSTTSRKSATTTTIEKVNLPRQIDWRTTPGKIKIKI